MVVIQAVNDVLVEMAKAVTKTQNGDPDSLAFDDSVAEMLVEIPYDKKYDAGPDNFFDPIEIGIWTKDDLAKYKALSPDERLKIWASAKPLQDYLDIKDYFVGIAASVKKILEDLAIKLGIMKPKPVAKQSSILPLLLLGGVAAVAIYATTK